MTRFWVNARSIRFRRGMAAANVQNLKNFDATVRESKYDRNWAACSRQPRE
jgi:hypothetical protein